MIGRIANLFRVPEIRSALGDLPLPGRVPDRRNVPIPGTNMEVFKKAPRARATRATRSSR